MKVIDRINHWSHDRQLSGSRRAGAWSRSKALETQRRFVASSWRGIAGGTAIAALTVVPLVLTINGTTQAFLLGCLLTGWIATIWHLVVVVSGSSLAVMGDLGEQWTHQEVRTLRREGWRLAHQVSLYSGRDIDTIAIGPGGVLVLETKWSSTRWSEPSQRRWVDDARVQLRGNVGAVRGLLRGVLGSMDVASAVVLWPADRLFTDDPDASPPALPGHELLPWIRSLPRDRFTTQQTERAWALLVDQVAKRDEHDLANLGPRLRSPLQVAIDVVAYPLGFLLGALLGVFPYAAGFWPGVVTYVSLILAARLMVTVDALNRWAQGFIFGLLVMGLWLLGLVLLNVVA